MTRLEPWLRVCVLILLWIAAHHLLRPAIDAAMGGGRADFFNGLIAKVLAAAAVLALDMFWRPTMRRVLRKLLGIAVLLALTLPLAFCSAASHWGQ